ncbi:hypothetical protein ALC56_10783 [Trachymyrmex septentrionalis]|uniref:Uncharacterized protein n=1 Tax=Trachymyrmex septentrionalis TaxID=34720 RepID=A0A195F2L6_9HYME|nr:hypothetical protein ALC56_10783 [Trachymyrmex septentrionalis]
MTGLEEKRLKTVEKRRNKRKRKSSRRGENRKGFLLRGAPYQQYRYISHSAEKSNFTTRQRCFLILHFLAVGFNVKANTGFPRICRITTRVVFDSSSCCINNALYRIVNITIFSSSTYIFCLEPSRHVFKLILIIIIVEWIQSIGRIFISPLLFFSSLFLQNKLINLQSFDLRIKTQSVVLAISRSFPRHEPPPTVSYSPVEETPNRAIDPVCDVVIDDRESVGFFFSAQTRLDQIGRVNRSISYSINQTDIIKDIIANLHGIAFSHTASLLAVIIGI